MERIFNHLRHGRQRVSLGFFFGADGECVLDEAEGHATHQVPIGHFPRVLYRLRKLARPWKQPSYRKLVRLSEREDQVVVPIEESLETRSYQQHLAAHLRIPGVDV